MTAVLPRPAPPRDAGRPVVLFVDVEPWEGFLQFAAALRRRGVRVERLTSTARPLVRRVNDALQRPVFTRIRPVVPTMHAGAGVARFLRAERPEGLVAIEAVDEVAVALADVPGLPKHTADPALEALLYDKLAMNGHLARQGLAVPRSFPAEAAHPLVPPFVVKPRLGAGGARVVRVEDDATATAAAAEARANPGTLMAQELLPGELLHVGGVARAGEVLQLGCYRGVGKPHSPFGPSAEVLTVADEATAGHAAAVVATLGYTGAICFDYVRGADGRALPVDVNARVFGSWAALQRAGLDVVGAWLYAWGVSAERPSGALPPDRRLRTLPPSLSVVGQDDLPGWLRVQLSGVLAGFRVLGPRWGASTVSRLLCAALIQMGRRLITTVRCRRAARDERNVL